jgi:hypothetical protein
MTRPMPRPLAIALVLGCVGAALSGAACDDKKAAETKASADAAVGTDKYITADPKLEKALQAAASAAPANDNGPPPDGIFGPGLADRRHPKGAPTKVDVVADGDEPRISLAATADPRPTSYGPGALELGMQMGPRSAAPTVDLGLAFGPAKEAPKDSPGAAADWLVIDVKRATPAKEQLGELPPGTDQAIATLQGTQVRVKLAADGGASEMETVLGKATPPELGRLAHNAAEALLLATVPLPPKPVGVGAQWIAETRMPLAGLDVIAYRAYRVKSIEGNRVRLTLDMKAYAADAATKLEGLPPGAKLEQVDALGQGEMELVRGEVLARKSDLQQRVVLMIAGSSVPDQADPSGVPGEPPSAPKSLTAQLQSQATFVRGDDLRAALHP